MTAPAATFIPVASGKGGVGKSLVAANLALCLARLGHPTVAVDLDLGGSNLHTYLGLGGEHAGLGEFVAAGGPPLAELLVESGQPGLQLLPGDGGLPFLANLGHAQKLKLLRGLQALPARFVVIDLGAGSTFNTLDYFLLSPIGLLVSTPEMPALLNLMSFLKQLVLRMIAQEVNRVEPLRQMIAEQRRLGLRYPAHTVAELQRQIAAVDPAVGRRVQQRLEELSPRLLLNMGDHPDDLEMLRPVARNLAERLSVKLEGFGFIHFDPQVRLAVRERRPLMSAFPNSLAARGIARVADRIVRLWHQPLESSLDRLEADTRGIHARWQEAGASPVSPEEGGES